jgi:hypothetical protein
MPAFPAPRRALVPVVAAVLTLLLGLSLGQPATGAPSRPSGPSAGADHTGVPGPIHAGNTWGWYQYGVFRQEFVGGVPRFWHKHPGTGNVREQHGMLTLNTGPRRTTSATLGLRGHRTGRWEIRMRARRYEFKHRNYQVLTELIPAGRPEHCGAQNIGIESFRLGKNTVKHFIHTLPDHTYRAFKGRNMGTDRWHTFAVEVARTHISWFVDAHIITTERRPAALRHVPLTLRFSLRAKPGKRMNRSRMQMDWMRYWSMRAKNERSIQAPQTTASTWNGGC